MTRRMIDLVMKRREFCLSLGAGMTILAIPQVAGTAELKKLPTATGIDALFVPFVVAADRKIFEKHGLEGSYKPFDDGNVALDAVITGSSDIGSTSELGGLARWDRGGRLYVTSILDKSKEQVGVTAREEVRKPEDLVGKTVGYPRASAGHYFFGRYVKKYKLPMDKIKSSGGTSTPFFSGSHGTRRRSSSSTAPTCSPGRGMTTSTSSPRTPIIPRDS